jgi:hypothetical protein
MLLPCELRQRGKLFLPIDESGDVCVWSQQAECAARNVDGKRECELGASVAMIRARDQNVAKEGGEWVGRACKCQVWSRLSRCRASR